MHKQQHFVCDVNPGGLSQCTVPLLQRHRQLLEVTLAVVDFVRRPMLLLSGLYGLFFLTSTFSSSLVFIGRVYTVQNTIATRYLRWH